MEQKYIYLGRSVDKQKQAKKKQASNLVLLIRFRGCGRNSSLVASKSIALEQSLLFNACAVALRINPTK